MEEGTTREEEELKGKAKAEGGPDGCGGDKLVVCMVGLPARCKSFIARKIKRFFNWMTIKAEVFNAGQRRRQEVAGKQGSEWFDKNNRAGMSRREQLALDTLQAALDFLLWEDGKVAVFDATNTTRKRRAWVRELLMRAQKEHGVRFLFVESVFERPEMVQQNVLEKMDMSPDWTHMDRAAAEQDMWRRIHNYEAAYEPVTAEEALPYLRVVNFEHACLVNVDLATAYPLTKLAVAYVCSIHNGYRPITFTTEDADEDVSAPKITDAPAKAHVGHHQSDCCEHDDGKDEDDDDDDDDDNNKRDDRAYDADAGCECTTANASQAPALAMASATTRLHVDTATHSLPCKPDDSAVDGPVVHIYASGVWETGGRFSCDAQASAAFWAPLTSALTDRRVQAEEQAGQAQRGVPGTHGSSNSSSSSTTSTSGTVSSAKTEDGARNTRHFETNGTCSCEETKQAEDTCPQQQGQEEIVVHAPTRVLMRELHQGLDALLGTAPLLSTSLDARSQHGRQQESVAEALPKALKDALFVTKPGDCGKRLQSASHSMLLLGERDALTRSMGSEFTMPNSPRAPGTPTRSRVYAPAQSSVAPEQGSTEPAAERAEKGGEREGGALDEAAREPAAQAASKHESRGLQIGADLRSRVDERPVPSAHVENEREGYEMDVEKSERPALLLRMGMERCVSMIRRLLELEACKTSTTAPLSAPAREQESQGDARGDAAHAAAAAMAVLLSYYDYDGQVSDVLAARGAASIIPFHTEGSAAWSLAK